MTGERVLIVDDEAELRETLAERMTARGLTVATAASGAEALEILEHRDFDAVVLDLAMPGLDGVETLRRMLSINPDLQVILLTGQATVKKSIEVMKLGALDLLEKPTDLRVLIAKIEEASDKKALLFEQRTEKQISDILKKKGW
ncbi:MAG: response regulator [Candidatus Eiseniibacteriota bacterium]|jgi:DNA-binding NtrC family response regulator